MTVFFAVVLLLGAKKRKESAKRQAWLLGKQHHILGDQLNPKIGVMYPNAAIFPMKVFALNPKTYMLHPKPKKT